MRLEEFALIASDTTRTKAYLQAMICADRLPGICIVYSENIRKLQEDAKKYKMTKTVQKYFDAEIPLLYTLEKASVEYKLIGCKDINSEILRECINSIAQKYLIYSGYGGYILKSHLFELGKKWIHVHAGILPQYRGSTTVYYSFLQEGILGATAIFLNEGIDEGEIITSDTFQMPSDKVNIDYIYEPFIRSQVLLKVLNQYITDGEIVSQKQKAKNAETYYIIHPVLKHLALLRIEENYKEKEL